MLHDRETKFCAFFRSMLTDGGMETIILPDRSPNLNAFAERWVQSVKQESLAKLILFGEGPFSRTLTAFCAHYHSQAMKAKATSCFSRTLSMNLKPVAALPAAIVSAAF